MRSILFAFILAPSFLLALVFWEDGDDRIELETSGIKIRHNWSDAIHQINASKKFKSIENCSLFIEFEEIELLDIHFINDNFLEILHPVKLAELYSKVISFIKTGRLYSVLVPLKSNIYGRLELLKLLKDDESLMRIYEIFLDLEAKDTPPLFYLSNPYISISTATLAEMFGIRSKKFESVVDFLTFHEFLKRYSNKRTKIKYFCADLDLIELSWHGNKVRDRFAASNWICDFQYLDHSHDKDEYKFCYLNDSDSSSNLSPSDDGDLLTFADLRKRKRCNIL